MSKIANRKLEAVTIALLIAMSVISVVACALTFHSNKLYLNAEVDIARISEQLRRLDATLMTMQDAETGQRGYLLTHNRDYLQPYAAALTTAENSLSNLELSFRDEPRFRPQLVEIRRLKEQKFDELSSTIRLIDTAEHDLALELVKSNVGKMLMDRIRVLVGSIDQAKRQELVNIRTASIKRSRDAITSMYVLGAAMSVLLLSVYCYLVYDLRERRRLMRRAEFLENHDDLTGLYNRRFFFSLGSNALKQAFRDGRRIAVLLIKLNGFKELNAQVGYANGNALLSEVAARLLETARKGDQVARLGDGEFSVLVPNVHSEEELAMLSNRLIDALTPSLIAETPEKYVGVSIGIAIGPDDGHGAEELLSLAHTAICRVKNELGSHYRFYRESIDPAPTREEMLTSGLHRAVEEGSFSLQFQPLINTSTQKTVSIEALLRWNHPQLGPITPDEFIPIAEKTGLILPIGAWVLREACTQVQQWNNQGHNWHAAVNISAVELIVENFSEHYYRSTCALRLAGRSS